jgi:enoyl-CoA hydratase/carnithine racemase
VVVCFCSRNIAFLHLFLRDIGRKQTMLHRTLLRLLRGTHSRRSHSVPNEPLVLCESKNNVAFVTMNRPAQRNALSLAMIGSLRSVLTDIGLDKSVRAVVLGGNGPAFCSGHDLKEIRADSSESTLEQVFRECSDLMLQITRLPQPVIARVHGIATAAGCQLVATCDLAVAADTAKFATPGVNIGLFCSTPMVALTRAVGRKAAMHMLLTGDMVPAPDALRMGLLSQVVPASELDAATATLAERIAAKSALTVRTGKATFYKQAELSMSDAYVLASAVMVRNMLATDAQEGVDAFLCKRSPVWRHE